MLKTIDLLTWITVAGLFLLPSGCGPESAHDRQDSITSKAIEQSEPSEASFAEAGPGLAQLSDADAAAAKKQRVCPVSGNVLGTMGKPFKVTVNGKDIFLCCPGCEEELRKNPEKYLKNIE